MIWWSPVGEVCPWSTRPRIDRVCDGDHKAVDNALCRNLITLRPDNITKNSLPTGSEMYDALVHCDESMGGIDMWLRSRFVGPTILLQTIHAFTASSIRHSDFSKRSSLHTHSLFATSWKCFRRVRQIQPRDYLELLPPPLKRLFVDGPGRSVDQFSDSR